MSSRDINTVMHNVLCGKASDEEHARLQQWLQLSEDHQHQWEQLQADQTLAERCRTARCIDEERAWKQFRNRHILRPRIAVGSRWAAAAAIIVIAVLALRRYQQPVRPVPDAMDEKLAAVIQQAKTLGKNEATLLVRGQKATNVASDSIIQDMDLHADADVQLITRHDKEFWMTLDDGTLVHLNYNSSLVYPLHFTGNSREVELVGEAYFFVAHDSKRPFYVKTPDGVVKQYGTEFNINTRGATEVVLVNGSISVSRNGGQERMLHPGEKAVMADGISVCKVDVAPYTAWNTGLYSFEDCRLDQLMEVLTRWYGLKVTFADPTLKNRRITGVISRYKDIANSMQAISEVAGVDIQYEGESIVIQ